MEVTRDAINNSQVRASNDGVRCGGMWVKSRQRWCRRKYWPRGVETAHSRTHSRRHGEEYECCRDVIRGVEVIHSFHDTMWWRFPFPVPGLDFVLPERDCGNTRVLLTWHCKHICLTVVLAVLYFLLLWIFVAFSGSAPEETLVRFASQGLDILPYTSNV